MWLLGSFWDFFLEFYQKKIYRVCAANSSSWVRNALFKFVVQIDSEIILNLKMEKVPENSLLIRICQLKLNSALVTQDSFIAFQIFAILLYIVISMKMCVCIWIY